MVAARVMGECERAEKILIEKSLYKHFKIYRFMWEHSLMVEGCLAWAHKVFIPFLFKHFFLDPSQQPSRMLPKWKGPKIRFIGCSTKIQRKECARCVRYTRASDYSISTRVSFLMEVSFFLTYTHLDEVIFISQIMCQKSFKSYCCISSFL